MDDRFVRAARRRKRIVWALLFVGASTLVMALVLSHRSREQARRTRSVREHVHNALFASSAGVARKQMVMFALALDQHRLLNKEYPPDLSALTQTSEKSPEPLLESIPPDPWGNGYEYRRWSAVAYELRSHGEDGTPDTEDDIVHVPSASR